MPDADAPLSARSRRQAVLLLAVVNALVLAIGTVASVDLRRLRTPGGTALRWVQAAVFGDGAHYRPFSGPAGAAPDDRTDAALGRDLRAATAPARNDSLRIGLHLGQVVRRGDRAAVDVELDRGGEQHTLHLTVVRHDGRWRVVRDASTCASVGCA